MGEIAAIDVLHGEKRSQQQPRTEQQQHRGRYFTDDQEAAQSATPAGRRPAVGCVELRTGERRRLPGRRDAEHQTYQQRGQRTERRHPRVEGERHRSRQEPLRDHGRCQCKDRCSEAIPSVPHDG